MLTSRFQSIRGYLFIIIGTFTSVSLVNYLSHKSYYETIRNVQTVDFNILANNLPTKLSLLLKEGDSEEIQNTINSNFGLFGIVVTDCQSTAKQCNEQRILYKSQTNRRGWLEKVNPSNLIESDFSILRDPAPLTAEWQFQSPRSTESKSTGRLNTGRPIGRVYFVRSNPPRFIESIHQWLKVPIEAIDILSKTGNVQLANNKLRQLYDYRASRYYFLTSSAGIIVAILSCFLLANFQRRKALLEKAHTAQETALRQKLDSVNELLKESKKDRDNLQKQIDDFSSEKNHLRAKLGESSSRIEKLEKEKNVLQEEKHILDSDLQKLQEDIEGYQLIIDASRNDSLSIQNEIEKVRKSLADALQTQANLRLKISSYQESIIDRDSEIKTMQQQKNKFESELNEKDIKILSLQERVLQLEESMKAAIISQDRANQSLSKGLSQKNFDEEIRLLYTNNSLLQEQNDKLVEKIFKLKNKNDYLSDCIIQFSNGTILRAESLQYLEDFNSISEVVEYADANLKNLKILHTAKMSASNYSYNLIGRNVDSLYDSLLILDNLSKQYFSDKNLEYSWRDYFRGYGIQYAEGESEATRNQYSQERTFWDPDIGRNIVMMKHLKIGIYLRVHFEAVDECQKIVVGYCGNHLPIARD